MRRIWGVGFLLLACESGATSGGDDSGTGASAGWATGGHGPSSSGGTGTGGARTSSGGNGGLSHATGGHGSPALGGSAGDAGSSPGLGGSGAGGSGNSETAAVFVAQGHAGRTVVSCDGGIHWVGEHSAFDEYQNVAAAELRCWSGEVNHDPISGEDFELECDHHAFPGRGIAYGGGAFVATFGWGDPGAVRASTDGTTWVTGIDQTTFGGVGFVQGTWIAAAGNSQLSTDGGRTFAPGPSTTMRGNVRRVGTHSGHGGRMILVGDDAEARITSDGGHSWWTPEAFPSSCGSSIQTEGGIASNGSVWLVVGGDGVACRSLDGGETWTATSVGTSSLSSHLVWDGELFMVWSRGKRYASPDGSAWMTTDITPGNVEPGPAAASDNGRIVAVRGGWDVWYEDQRFYRSDDGLTWVEADSYWGGHPIRSIAFGVVERPEECDE